jgi:BlaI family penicillinase repressor
MPPRVQDVTAAELAILQVLWETGGATVRQLVDRLYPSAGPSAPPTVQKLLERLEAKGHAVRDRSGQVAVFRAAIDRSSLIRQRARNLAEELCGGSLTSLLTHLVEDEGLGAEERRALHKLVDDWDSSKRGKAT